MSLTKTQFIIITAVGVLAIIFFLIFKGFIPGRQIIQKEKPSDEEQQIQFWGVFDSEKDYETAIRAFEEYYKNVRIEYREFNDQASYNSTLLDALASGTGPDIFMVRSDDVARNQNKIAPFPDASLAGVVRSAFPRTVERDFTRGGQG